MSYPLMYNRKTWPPLTMSGVNQAAYSFSCWFWLTHVMTKESVVLVSLRAATSPQTLTTPPQTVLCQISLDRMQDGCERPRARGEGDGRVEASPPRIALFARPAARSSFLSRERI